jgi:hypothetical protein
MESCGGESALRLRHVERVSAQGAKHVLEAAVTGVVIGALAAIPAHLLLAARNLRWTWALASTAVGAVAVWATVVEAWSVALLVGGLCSCRWAWLLERRDREAGGEARRRVRRAVGVGDTLGRRRERRELRTGRLAADGGFLLGTDAKACRSGCASAGSRAAMGCCRAPPARASRTRLCGPSAATWRRASAWW